MSSLTKSGNGSICNKDVLHNDLDGRDKADAHPDTSIEITETYTGNLAGKTTQAEANAVLDAFSGGGGLPEGNKYEALTIGGSDSKPLFKGGAFSLRPDGVLWQEIDVASMSRQTPSSYSASSESLPASPVANAFDDDINTRWISDIDVNDAYIDIDFASAVSLSVLGIYLPTNLRPKFITVTDRLTDEILLYYETLRNNHVYNTNLNRIQYLTLDKIVSTAQIRIRFKTDWFIGNKVSCSVLQFYSGTLVYKPIGLFTNAGQFSLLSQTESTSAQQAEMFRPVSYAGHSQRVNTFGTRTLQTTDIDSYQRMASTSTYTLPQDADLWGRALHCATQSSNTCIVKVASSRSGLINGERVSNLNYTIPKYTSVKLVYTSDSATTDWEFIPSVPEMLYCGAGRKSTDARKLDDYYELDANVNLVASGGTLTIGATNKVISSVKVGQNVNISGYLDVSVATSPTGTLTITGLPHTCRSGLKYDSELSISVEGVTIPADHYWSAYVINNTTTIRIRLLDLTGTVVDASPYITTDAKIRIGGIYNASS